VSAASGAVGQVVGQLLKNVYGCRVVGSAGGDDKVGAGVAGGVLWWVDRWVGLLPVMNARVSITAMAAHRLS